MQNTNKASEINRSENQPAKIKLRQQYFLERELIRREIGDLNQIREQLGLSQRRLCRLLLVDPSAWTRWLKDGAPPHVYQTLRWLLQLRKANPEVTGPRDLEGRLDQIHSSHHKKIEGLENQVAGLIRELSFKDHSQEQRFYAEIARLEHFIAEKLRLLSKRPEKKRAAKHPAKRVTKRARKTPVKKKRPTKAKRKGPSRPKPYGFKRRARGGRR